MRTYNYSYPDVLVHSGIKGQKLGVRRYQNENGSRTNSVKKRYSSFKRGPVRNTVNSALVDPVAYSDYIQQRAAGIAKGRAIVNTLFAGSLASAKVRSDYINQDAKKDRPDAKAIYRAGRKFNSAANEYRNARESRSKKDIERYEKSSRSIKKSGISRAFKKRS